MQNKWNKACKTSETSKT